MTGSSGAAPPATDYRHLHPDPLVTQTLDKVLGSLPPGPAGPGRVLRSALVGAGVGIGVPLVCLAAAARNLVRRRAPVEPDAGYVLFLPNLNQNLATMAAVCSALADVPVVFCCPHTVAGDALEALLRRRHGGRWWIAPVHWPDFVRFRMAPEYLRFAGRLLGRFATADVPVFSLIVQLCKFSFYGIVCTQMRDIAFSRILARAPAVIVSARPKSHYANLPFLHAARERDIPAYYLAHTHVDPSRHFQYQVFRPGLFRGFFLFSTACRRIAEEHFTVDGDLIVTGDPTLDERAAGDGPARERHPAEPGRLRVMYAASTFYGQDSMCDLVDIVQGEPGMTLSIKTRPPGNNVHEIREALGDRDTASLAILDHARVGPIEELLDTVDVVVGCATNAVINAVLRGVPAVVYINALDDAKIAGRAMQILPYEAFGIPVVREPHALRRLLTALTDERRRERCLEEQRERAAGMYPNLRGRPARAVMAERIRAHLGR